MSSQTGQAAAPKADTPKSKPGADKPSQDDQPITRANRAALLGEIEELRAAKAGLSENNKALLSEKAALEEKYKQAKSAQLQDAEKLGPMQAQMEALLGRAEQAEGELTALKVHVPLGDLFVKMGGVPDVKDLITPVLARGFQYEEGGLVAYEASGAKRLGPGGDPFSPEDAIAMLRAERPGVFRPSQTGDMGGAGYGALASDEITPAIIAARGDRRTNVAYARAQIEKRHAEAGAQNTKFQDTN